MSYGYASKEELDRHQKFLKDNNLNPKDAREDAIALGMYYKSEHKKMMDSMTPIERQKYMESYNNWLIGGTAVHFNNQNYIKEYNPNVEKPGWYRGGC